MLKLLKFQNLLSCHLHYLFPPHVICCVIAVEKVAKNETFGNQPAASGPVFAADQSTFVGTSPPYYQVFIKFYRFIFFYFFDLSFVAKSVASMWIDLLFSLFKWLGNSAITFAIRCSCKSLWRELPRTCESFVWKRRIWLSCPVSACIPTPDVSS